MRLPKSWAVRIATVGAAAAIAVTGATAANAATAAGAGTASPAHVHRIATHLTIKNSAPVLNTTTSKTTSVIDGRLMHGTHGLRYFRVYLERQGAHGYWHVVQHAASRKYGHVFFRVQVGKKAASFRLVFRGTANFARSTSLVDTIAPATAS
jgi:hypothetical protein